MIMYSYKHTIAVTNRTLVEGDYLEQIEKVASVCPEAILLREKDLSEESYLALAKEVRKITEKYQVKLILHSHISVVKELEYDRIHLPLVMLQELKEDSRQFTEIGVSIHSIREAILAENLGATYLTAGHIFQTDCKKGSEPRGLDFLSAVIDNVKIPVYAIGGITKENAHLAMEYGAAGVCMMSGVMKM